MGKKSIEDFVRKFMDFGQNLKELSFGRNLTFLNNIYIYIYKLDI
jgi:hypothetical protein